MDVQTVAIDEATLAFTPGLQSHGLNLLYEEIVHATATGPVQEQAIHGHPQCDGCHAAEETARFEEKRARTLEGRAKCGAQAGGSATRDDDIKCLTGERNELLDVCS